MSFSLSKLTQLNDSKAKERKSNFRPGGAKPRPRPCPPGAQALPKTTEAQAPPEPREAPAEPHEAPPEPKEAPAAPHEAPPEPHEAPAEPHKAPAEPEKTQHGPPAALLAAQAPAEASKPLGARSPAPAEPPPRPLPAAEAAVTAPPEAPRPTAAPSGDVPPGPGSEGLMVSPSKAGPLRSGAQAVTSGPEPTRQSASTAPSAAPSEPPGTADDEGGVSGSDDDPEASLSGLHLKRKGKPKAKGKVTAPASEGCEGGGQQTKPRAVDGDHRSGKGAGSKQTGEEDGAVATSPRRRGKPRKRSAGRSTGQTEEGALDNAMAALSKTEEQRDTRESEPRQKRKYTRRKGKEHAEGSGNPAATLKKSFPPPGSRRRKRALPLEEIPPEQRTISDIIRASLKLDRKNESERMAEARARGDVMQAAADAAKDQANREERVNEGEQEKGAPQVQVVDGKIIINRDTLVVEAQRSGDAGDIAEFKRVLEDQPLLNSRSYSSWVPAQRWKEDETELFYQALGAFGTDLTLITRLFPSRERGQVKRKYLMECRKNPARVDAAIKGLNRDPAKLRQLIERLKQAETETLGTLTQPSAPSVPLLTSGSASTPRPSAANPRGGRDVSDSVATQEGPAAAAQPAHPYDNGMPLDDDEAYVY